MISFDTNLLFDSVNPGSEKHRAARDFFRSLEDNEEEVAVSELVLTELYCLLRNPAVVTKPLSAPAAVELVQTFRANPSWHLIESPPLNGKIMDHVWNRAKRDGFPRRAVYDARIAFVLRSWGVSAFATRNVKDFRDYGFTRVWNPLDLRE